ncbi:MAG: CotH kinase family protein, partial [Verrucomicrobiales bacterium]|nr:CotH kinase family protein [Verrucomicrobiales bacterium]
MKRRNQSWWLAIDDWDAPGLHANFKLSKEGEELLLIDTDANLNAVLDSVGFGAPPTDRSYGRRPIDSATFIIMQPTPADQTQLHKLMKTQRTELLHRRSGPGGPSKYPHTSTISDRLRNAILRYGTARWSCNQSRAALPACLGEGEKFARLATILDTDRLPTRATPGISRFPASPLSLAAQFASAAWALLLALSVLAQAQPAGERLPREGGPNFEGPPPFGPGGAGRGGFGGMMRQEIKLVKQFDKDGDNRLNAAERKAAREFLQSESAAGRGRRGPFGGRGGPRGENQAPPQPGRKLSLADVKSFPDAPLYEPSALRTFFLEFEDSDWEKQLIEFHNTDVEVPAKLIVDGKTYQDVGIHFSGMSSFGVGEGRKHSINLSLDFARENQQLGGYRTLNLLNSHEDPTFLRSVLFYQIAREYVPAPKANLARVVINGESWGVYVNAQQFNKEFVKDWFGTTKGARWKVPGSPGGRGSLAYLGEDVAAYKGIYEIKSKDTKESWADLIKLCKVLNETPPDQLEKALAPILDID